MCDDFFYDKDQIYYLGYYTVKECGRPISHFCKVIGENDGSLFKVRNSYCCINDQAYLRKIYSLDSIALDPSTIREYQHDSYYSTYLITDGNKVYINSLHYQGPDFTEIEGLSNLNLKLIIPKVSTWYYNPETNMVYLQLNAEERMTAKGDYRVLMYSDIDNQIFIVNRDGKYEEYKGLLIPQNEDNSPHLFDAKIDLDQLKHFESYTYTAFMMYFIMDC